MRELTLNCIFGFHNYLKQYSSLACPIDSMPPQIYRYNLWISLVVLVRVPAMVALMVGLMVAQMVAPMVALMVALTIALMVALITQAVL